METSFNKSNKSNKSQRFSWLWGAKAEPLSLFDIQNGGSDDTYFAKSGELNSPKLNVQDSECRIEKIEVTNYSPNCSELGHSSVWVTGQTKNQ